MVVEFVQKLQRQVVKKKDGTINNSTTNLMLKV